MSHYTAHPTKHEVIKDAIYGMVLSIDTNDTSLFEMNGNALTGLDSITNGMFANVGPLDTTHFITNIRIVAESDNSAKFSASALAQHCRAGEGNLPNTGRLLSGSLYDIDVERDDRDGLWKCRNFSMKLVWNEGDTSIVAPEVK